MKVALLNYYDNIGGAGRAAYRIHHALRRNNIDSHLYVGYESTGDPTVIGPQSRLAKELAKIRKPAGGLLNDLMRTENPVMHSPSVFPSRWHKRLNASDVDIVNLHWVTGELISIRDIGKIRKPVVWTLHDMWAFCGAEHYTNDERWRTGYKRNNRPPYESGLDINRWVWNRKRKFWRDPMHIVTPSHWLAKCVRESALMHEWPVSVIHNAIDTEAWRPVDQALARQLLDLPSNVPILLFGAMGGGMDPRKGYDLLKQALLELRGRIADLQILVLGQLQSIEPENVGFPVRYLGHMHDDLSLRLVYSAVDALVLPSRQDNLPNTGVEAMACGTPVVAFGAGGLPDIVTHQKTGYLAEAFRPDDMAEGIEWVLSDQQSHANMRQKCRLYAVENFAYPVIAEQYIQLYKTFS